MTRTHAALEVFRRVIEDQRADEVPDQELVERFVAARDEPAFRALLHRHGPMVLGVCRALLRNEADAEDAFQATFLTLARQARSIRNTASLASWLHGVAYRTARRAQTAFARRHRHEPLAARPEAAEADDRTWAEVQQVLHEELSGLPERYRDALTLCYLQGHTLDEAATRLGLGKSTLKTRLERGRALLRARLEGRGLGSAAVLLAAAWPACAVPAALVDVTATAAQHLTRVKFAAAVLSVLAVLGTGLLVCLLGQPPEEKPDVRPPVGVARELAVLRGHTNLVWSVALTPDGRTLVSGGYDKTVRVWDVARGKERLTLRGLTGAVDGVAITPDGKTVAAADRGGVRLWDLSTGKERPALKGAAGPAEFLSFSTDGLRLTAGSASNKKSKEQILRQWDLATGRELVRIEHTGHTQEVVSPDGTLLARGGMNLWNRFDAPPLRLLELPSGRERTVFPPTVAPWAFGPDARTLFTIHPSSEAVQLWEVATGKVRLTTQKVDQFHLVRIAVHPSGRLLAIPREDVPAVRLIDLATGKACADLKIDNERLFALAFSADGNTLAASEGPDSAVRVWDVSGVWKARPPLKERLTEKELAAAWADLAGDDAARAYRAVWLLAGAPKQAVPYIAARLKPVAASDAVRTAALIAALEDDRFAAREKAGRELTALGETALSALNRALAARPPAETKRRIERLLEELQRTAASPEGWRVTRAVEALERAGTPEARKALEQLAGGVPQAQRTGEARAALERFPGR